SPYGTQLYDADGDLRTNHSGNWEYEYDYENQLTLQYRYDTSIHQNHKATEWQYDGLHRLRRRFEWHWEQQQTDLPSGIDLDTPVGGSGGSWVLDSETRYIYDGMRVIQERDGNNTPTVSYTRGNDLSLSLEGAGGIGGLLARSSGYSGGNWTSHAYYYADAGGNITSMTDGNQAVVASYRYDPY